MQQKVEENISQHQGNQSRVTGTVIQRKKQELLRINADDYSTKHLAIFWTIFFVIIILISIIAVLALPKTFIFLTNRQTTRATNIPNCTNPIGFDNNNKVKCQQMNANQIWAGLLLRGLSNKNQFIEIFINVVLPDKSQSYLQIQQTIILEMYSLQKQINNHDQLQFIKLQQKQSQQFVFKMLSSQSQLIFQQNGYSFKGYRKTLGYQKYIQNEDSLMMLKFKNWPLNNIKQVYLQFQTINPQFTIYTILIRYILFAITIGTSIIYYVRYRLIADNLKTMEQKWVFYLSIFTVLFNDPLYAATILAPNGFTAFISVAFIVNFITFMVAFWIIFVDRIFYESGQKFQNVLTKKKLAYFAILYISFFLIQFQLALLRLDSDNPILPTEQLTNGRIRVFYGISLVVFFCGIIYIVVKYVRNFPTLLDKIWRNQIFLIFSVFYIVLLVITFVVNGFGVYEYIGDQILIIFTIMNMYTIYMQYMYSVTKMELTKLQNNYLLNGGNVNTNQNIQIQTIMSNFANQDVIVDLDSQQGHGEIWEKSQQNYNHKHKNHQNQQEFHHIKNNNKQTKNHIMNKQVQKLNNAVDSFQRKSSQDQSQSKQNNNNYLQQNTIHQLHQFGKDKPKQDKSFGQFQLQ